jgi:ureidoglycolate hydrolase
MTTVTQRLSLPAQQITAEAFAPYGQVIFPTADGKPFDQNDAQLDLSHGTPRFYIMRLNNKGLNFGAITRHWQCTQCLGSLGGQDWFLAVAPPSPEPKPNRDHLMAFQITGDCFVKLAIGTWHSGPYFESETADFYNLELSDTNLVDHETYSFSQQDRVEFQIAFSKD